MAVHCAAIFIAGAQVPPGIIIHGADAGRADGLGAALTEAGIEQDSSIRVFILEWYREHGYYRTEVDSMSGGDAEQHIWLTEGRPTYLSLLTLSGLTGRWKESALASMELREGDIFVESLIRTDIERIIRLLADDGYLDVRIDSDEVYENEDDDAYRLSVGLAVRMGNVSRMDSVVFSGLSVTHPATAVTISGLERSGAWSSRAGDAARRRLRRSRIFSEVSEPRLIMKAPAVVRVAFDVREGKANSFDGVVGYLPPPTGLRTGTVTGLVDVHFGNLFGTARQLHARWYQERQQRHEIEVGYREPAIFGWLVSGDIGLFQRRQDSSFVRFDGRLAFDAEVGLDMFAGLSFSSTTTTPVEGYGKTILPKSSAIFAGARFAYDTRDKPFPTRSGVLYATTFDAGRKSSSFNGASRVSGMQKISFDAEFYYPTFLYQTLSLTARWREVTGNGVDESDLYRLGGSTNLRGYRENEFVGSRLIWQSTEYRFFLSPSSYIGGFVDLGSIHVGSVVGTIASKDLFRVGYGITSLVDTPIGSVGVSIAMGKGDGIGDAKLHVRLRTEF